MLIPHAPTPLLRSLGYNEYQIRRFWSFFEDIGNLRIEMGVKRVVFFNFVPVGGGRRIYGLTSIPLKKISFLELYIRKWSNVDWKS